MAEQNLSWSLDMNPLSPQIASFSDESTFPFYWHLPLKLLANEWQTGKPGFGNNRPIKTVDWKLPGASGWWRHQYARRVTCLDSMERWYRLLPSGPSLPCPICLFLWLVRFVLFIIILWSQHFSEFYKSFQWISEPKEGPGNPSPPSPRFAAAWSEVLGPWGPHLWLAPELDSLESLSTVLTAPA